MTRLAALMVWATPAIALAASKETSLRGAQAAAAAADDGVGVRRGLSEMYEHIGCFKDSRETTVLKNPEWSEDMTAAVCYERCHAIGAHYMSTQWGKECWCSRMEDLYYAENGEGVCDIECAGDPDEICGGYYAFDLYRLISAEEPTDPEYVGCFKDTDEERVMTDMLVNENMTTDMCRSHCEGTGAEYYATQYSNECFCGKSDVASDYEVHGDGICHMRCAGDDPTACGGYWAFSLYKFADAEVPAPTPDREAPAPTPRPVAAPTAEPVMPVAPAPEPEPEVVPAPTPSPVTPATAPTREPTPERTPEPTPTPVTPSTPEPTPAPVTPATPEPTPAPVTPSTPEPTPAPVSPEPAPEPEPTSPVSGGMYGSTYTGDGTYYAPTDAGNCAYKGNVLGMYSGMIPMALNAAQYGDSTMCGACVEGTASGGGSGANPFPSRFKGFIQDKCPECSEGDLDAMTGEDGRWEISWEFVACPGERVSFEFEGSHEYYWKIQPRGTKTPVETLTVNGQEGSRTDDNHFEVHGTFQGTQTVEITTVAGETTTHEVSL